MLDRHLTVKTYGTALEENIVLWRDYRVTVLDAGLFRIEKNDKCVWRDKATQSVWYRNMPPQHFSVEKGENSSKISTQRATLLLKPSIEDCMVELAGELLKIDNAGNLLGTYRTLDNCDGDMCFIDWDKHKRKYIVPLGVGVCSRSGLAVLDDADSLSLDDLGVIEAEKGVGIDRYVFVYGADYRSAVNALYKITGMPPMLPRYAFGNWWSRYFAYTDRSYLTLLDKFENNDVPLTVATLDMDWHYSHDLEQEFGVSNSNTYDEEKLDFVTRNFSFQVSKIPELSKIRFHDLRHSCAALLRHEGVPMEDIQKWLGHSQITTTESIYAHFNTERHKNSAQKILNAFSDDT